MGKKRVAFLTGINDNMNRLKEIDMKKITLKTLRSLSQIQKIDRTECSEYQRAYAILAGKLYGVQKDGSYYVGNHGDWGLIPSQIPQKNSICIE